MTEPPRKRFQIHLSTAVVMMFVAGGLIWVNFYQHRISEVYEKLRPALLNRHFVNQYGWPLEAMREDQFYYTQVEFPNDRVEAKCAWDAKGVATDTGVALNILFAVWFLCEWLIRRAARKGA